VFGFAGVGGAGDEGEGGVRRGVEVQGGAADEGGGEAPGHADEEEAEGPV